MKKVMNPLKVLFLIAILAVATTSCKKEKIEYQVRIQNEMQNDFNVLGVSLPFMKYDVKSFTLGDQTYTDVSVGSYSDYVTIESSTDYEMSVNVDVYFYNVDTFQWDFSSSESFQVGTETWNDEEDFTKFKIKLEIGTFLQAYKPVFETFGE
ncbi:MAG: hypothetical protein JEZ03_07165 [Bacteroidales bacterium]|nr:hypothetical protein [Bacteroidales bacterium]